MRVIKLENLEYMDYNAIMKVLVNTIPFALINQYYNADFKIGFFNFWDSDYIPESLKPFIMQPPTSREAKEEMSLAISKILEKEDFSTIDRFKKLGKLRDLE